MGIFFPVSLMVLQLLYSTWGYFAHVQCPVTNISVLKQKHKDQPGVAFTVKSINKRAKVARQLKQKAPKKKMSKLCIETASFM